MIAPPLDLESSRLHLCQKIPHLSTNSCLAKYHNAPNEDLQKDGSATTESWLSVLG